MLTSQITALEKKVAWLQDAKKEDDDVRSRGPASEDSSKGTKYSDGAFVGKDMEVYEFGDSSHDYGQEKEAFDLKGVAAELPGQDRWESNRRTEAKAMVIKYFRAQPTAATIKAVLRKLDCGQIEPVAIRSKRVGHDFIALVRFSKAEDLRTVLSNRLLLKGTSLWIDVDKFEKDWGRKTEPEPKPLSSYPHTELWSDVFQDRPRNKGNGPGNGRRRGRGRGSGWGSGRSESWQEVLL